VEGSNGSGRPLAQPPSHPGRFTPWKGFTTTIGYRPVYAAIFIDAVHGKIRDGQVANRPIYDAIGVTLTGGD